MASLPFLCPSDLEQSNTLCRLHHLSKEVHKYLSHCSHYNVFFLGDIHLDMSENVMNDSF